MSENDSTDSRGSTPQRFTPPSVDPWRGFRGVMAGTLILEAIVIALAFPIVWRVGGGLTVWSGLYLGLLTLAMILGSGLQGRSWALPYNLALQVITIAGWAIHWSIGVVGVVFGIVWVYIAYIKRDVRLRMERGQLNGQEPIDD